MLRILLRLLGIKDFDTCKSCETLKEQLLFERDEKKRLTDTLLNIIKPKEHEAPPIEVNQIASTSALFSRRRAALEAKAREDAMILRNSTNVGRPDIKAIKHIDENDKTSELEKELGIEVGESS